MRKLMLSWLVASALVLALYVVNNAMGEDGAWIWVCDLMGNGDCGPGQPWLTWQPGGAD